MAHIAPGLLAPASVARAYGRVSMTVARGDGTAETLPPAPLGPRRILVVDDDTETAAEVALALRADDLDVTCCPSTDDLAACVHSVGPDVILVRSRREDPWPLLAMCQMHDVGVERVWTIIAYSAGDGHEDAVVHALRCGADDYIADAGRGRELRARVDAQLRHLRDREVMRWARDQRLRLKDLANTDGLTGIANRRGGVRAIEQALATGEPFALVLLDLDHFKQINDTFGHAMGDLVLKNVAHEIDGATPPAGTAARWGGEEFAIVVPGHDSAGLIGERFRRAVANVELDEADGVGRVTASVGVVEWCGRGVRPSTARLVATADAALYQSKNEGRNRVSTALALAD